jgi:hypothetical protein
MKGAGFWVAAVALVIVSIAWYRGFDPVADVNLTLDEHATEEHCFEGTTRIYCERARTGYTVRGGTLRARVTGISDLGTENGVHRAYVNVHVSFDIDRSYRGWGLSDLDRPILYGFVTGAQSVGEGMRRHTEDVGEIALLSPIAPPPRTRYAPIVSGACSTDYRHDLCRFRAMVPITGDTSYLRIHLRERFR